jgi:magnesium-transporting ATPase (P-type)
MVGCVSRRYMTHYNLIFTSFPLGIKVLFDRDSQHQVLTKLEDGRGAIVEYLNLEYLNPYFYRRGQINSTFNNASFSLWILKGIVQAFFIWLTSTYSVNYVPVNRDGYCSDFWLTSITMFTSIYIVRACLT